MEKQPILLDGRWLVPAGSDIPVRSPFSGETLASVPACSAEDVGAAVGAARRALDGGWPQYERAALLDRAAEALAQAREDLARTISGEAAKPIKTARVEAERAVSTFRFAAAECRKLAGEMVPFEASGAGAGKLGFALRIPIGVVGAITPFNFPLNLVAHKVAPAIAAGCPVVLKPATATPLSALALAHILHDAGLPAGFLNVVTGGGATVGDALVAHPDVACVSFTGSAEVGWAIRSREPKKKVGLELGSNSPLIVEATSDFATAARKVPAAAFGHAGQSCISTQRIYVQSGIYKDFLDVLVPAVEALVVGDPADETTDVSQLITTAERDRVLSWIDEARGAGATVATGGTVDTDGVLAPTVLTGVTPELRVCREEVFGPVVTVQPYATFDEAIDLANDSRLGLQAAVFTSDLGRALAAARRLEFGGVMVNEVPTFRADQQPYGGMKDSGNTREGPAYAIRQMTELRVVSLQG